MKQHRPQWLQYGKQIKHESKPHEIHHTTLIGACYEEGESKKKIWGSMLKLSKFDSTYCTNAALFISINCTNMCYAIPEEKMKPSQYSDVREFDSMLKWFTSLFYIQQQEPAAAFFPFVTFSCSAPWQGLLTLLCNQHGRNLTCSTREASY